jgi:3-hydroxyisobutyrate dehydrogenase-like beta-hydroxyacid dehydrogenase
MRAAVAGSEIGAAAAIKMVRSVMIKGLEALTYECFLAAARAGIEDEIIATLSESFPTLNWPKIIEYNLRRMARHGVRRAAEMEEVAEALRELGIDPLMVTATGRRQREMGELGKRPAIQRNLKQGRAAILNAISTAARDRH